MNYVARALAEAMSEDNTPYAWIIDVDHLDRGEDGLGNPRPDDDQNPVGDEGTMGPRNAPDDLIERLKNGEGNTFRMYDDDQILYYTGRGLSQDDEWDENACFGPLDDFGTPNAGAVWIRWHGHPERDNG